MTCLPYLLLPLYSFPSLNCSSRLHSFRSTTVFITTSIDATPLQAPKFDSVLSQIPMGQVCRIASETLEKWTARQREKSQPQPLIMKDGGER